MGKVNWFAQTKERGVTGSGRELTWCVLHGYHQGLVLQEVLVVLNDVWVVEQLEHLTLVLGRQAFVP